MKIKVKVICNRTPWKDDRSFPKWIRIYLKTSHTNNNHFTFKTRSKGENKVRIYSSQCDEGIADRWGRYRWQVRERERCWELESMGRTGRDRKNWIKIVMLQIQNWLKTYLLIYRFIIPFNNCDVYYNVN